MEKYRLATEFVKRSPKQSPHSKLVATSNVIFGPIRDAIHRLRWLNSRIIEFSPVAGEQAAVSPIVVVNFLNHDMDVFANFRHNRQLIVI